MHIKILKAWCQVLMIYTRNMTIIVFSDQTTYHHCSKHKYQPAIYVNRICLLQIFISWLALVLMACEWSGWSIKKVYTTRIQYCSSSFQMHGDQKTYT